MEKFIDIVIDTDGTVHVDMECYKGSGCDVDFQKLAKAIGTVSSQQRKQDYYEEGRVRIQGQE